MHQKQFCVFIVVSLLEEHELIQLEQSSTVPPCNLKLKTFGNSRFYPKSFQHAMCANNF